MTGRGTRDRNGPTGYAPGGAGRVTFHRPRGIRIPPDAGLERTFAGYDLDPATRALCDPTTLFYDAFRLPGGDEAFFAGPPFVNLGDPIRVTVAGRGARFAVYRHPWGAAERAVVLRVRLPRGLRRHPAPGVRIEFAAFAVTVAVEVPPCVPRERVRLMLGTMQRDNDPQWLLDWCRWHERVHDVRRVVVYDNGSADPEPLYADLAARIGADLVVVRWPYRYGPARPMALKYVQTAALNHCRLLFGCGADWCINLDVDEYLCVGRGPPVAERLARGERRAVVPLPSYVVPALRSARGPRCFDSAQRCRAVALRSPKYIYRPARTAFNEVHNAAPGRPAALGLRARAGRVLRALRLARASRSVLRAFRLGYRAGGRALAPRSAAAREPSLFFFHFRGLNTGWKVRQGVRPHDDGDDLVRDGRIEAMRAVLHAR